MRTEPSLSPGEFREALDFARSALERHPRGELDLPARRRIWDAMGPYEHDGDLPTGTGYKRRSRIDLLAAEKALALLPLDQTTSGATRHALELAERAVEKGGDTDLLRRQQQKVLAQADGFLAESQLAAGYGAHACAAAVSTVLVDHDVTGIPDELLDDQLDPDTWDASYYAALAATANENRPEQPRAFWSWYLEAAERAYDASTPRDQTAISSDGTQASPSRDVAPRLASEEDIKSRVVIPWLTALGFAPGDVHYETQLHLTIGSRFDVTIGERRDNDKPAYPDIICYINGRPLFVVEVKPDHDPLGKEARYQAISYARLLPQIAPFAVIANSYEAHVFDVVTGAEIHSVSDSEYYRNSGVISISPESRAEAKRALIELLLAA